jgi:hypothetical protein
MGWVLGSWRPGESLAAMPPSPPGLKLDQASEAYLQTLTAYFFPTVTTQIANVMCKRSWKSSLFSRGFLNAARRAEMLRTIADWRPPRVAAPARIDRRLQRSPDATIARGYSALIVALLVLPVSMAWRLLCRLAIRIERPVIAPLASWSARFLDRHHVIFNLISNPLINLGIFFELALCYLFFYSPLSAIYYFAPVPWHVYLFAFHGTLLLFTFEEVKKYYRRKGYKLEFLG